MALNLILSFIKVIFGFLGNSQAVIADGIHSFSDCITDMAIIVGAKYWTKPADTEHPYGHRRIETLITIFIGLLLAMVGVVLAYKAIITLPDAHSEPISIIALIAALISIIVKEILYRWTIYIGKIHKSTSIIANAWHHRSDGLSSIPVALAVGVAIFFPDLYYLDHIGSIIVSLFIFQVAYKIVKPALDELIDGAAPPEVTREIEQTASLVEGVLNIEKSRTRYLGARLHVDLFIILSADLSLIEANEIKIKVEDELKKQHPIIIDVLINIEPEKL